MKKIVLVLAVLLLAVPAMAAVEIIAEDEGGGVVAIKYDARDEDPDLVRAFAFDISVDNGTIDAISDFKVGESNDVEPGYGIFMGSIQINVFGDVVSYGDPVAPGGSPGSVGVLGDPNNNIELGSLYYDDVNAPDPCGLLCKITVSESCNVCITENEKRGGIVMEDPSLEVDVTLPCDIEIVVDCPCPGDIADTGAVIGPDGRVDTGDMGALLMELIINGNPADEYVLGSPSPDMLWCMDIADTGGALGPDGRIDTGDMGALLMHLIISGNPADEYEAGCITMP